MKLVSVRCDTCREVGGFGPSAGRVRFDLRSRLGWIHRQARDLCPDCQGVVRIDHDGDIVRRAEALAADKGLS